MGIPFTIVHIVMARDGGIIKIFDNEHYEEADALALELGAVVIDGYEPIDKEPA